MSTAPACHWAVSCPGNGTHRCKCSLYWEDEPMKLSNAFETVTPQYVCMQCGYQHGRDKEAFFTATVTHRGTCDICSEFEALYQARDFKMPETVERPVTIRTVVEKL